MNKLENKIITDKLESLDHLPESYHPNVNSKWDLLEEALNERESAGTRMNKTWLNIAACLLFLITSISLWFYMQRTITITLNQQEHPIHVIKNTEEPTVTLPKQTAIVKSVKATVKDPFRIENRIPEKENETVFVPEPLQPVKNTNTRVSENIAAPALAMHLPVKIKKQRYVQVDFNDSGNASAQVKQSVFAQSFRIKLGFGNASDIPDKSSVNTSSIKLRQNF